MSPFLRTTRAARYAALSLCALAAFNCSNESVSDSATALAGKTASVTMMMEFPSTPLIDSLVVDCIGADTLHYVIDPDAPYMDVDLFPHDHWQFKAQLYANGALMQRGETTAKLEAGTTNDITIQMHAVVGFVYVEIPLGLGNPAGIASGNMTIESGNDTYSYPMETAGTTAVFKSAMLPLEKDYTIAITMKDSAGTDIYSATETFRLSAASPVPTLQIKSLRAKVSFAIKAAADVNFVVETELPSKKSSPKPGDLLISEFLSAALKTDSTQYEFIELYNGTLDTLMLENCTLGITSQESKGWPITLSYIAPGKVAVFGDTSASTPAEYRNTSTWGDLTNTKGSIVLQCGGTVIDSLYYSATQDSVLNNLVPNNPTTSKNPQSTHLDIAQWQFKENPNSWCIGSPDPGTVGNCD